MDIFFQAAINPHLPLLKPIVCIAHRGNSKEAPENTSAAFQQAVNLGSDLLEVDVHLTKDEVPVIMHDLHLTRTTSKDYGHEISNLTFCEAQQFDIGAWFGKEYAGEKILSLEDAMSRYLEKIGFMIEIKAGSATPHKLVKAVMRVVSQFKEKSKIYIGSLSAEIGHILKESQTSYPIIGIIETESEFVLHEQYKPEIVAVSYQLLNQKKFRELRQDGKTVWVWTVDNPQLMHHFVQLRVDGIITNCPRELKQILKINSV